MEEDFVFVFVHPQQQADTDPKSNIVNEEIVVKVGPRGDVVSLSAEWDESSYGNVKQILVTHGNAINSIQIIYDINGTVALAHRHGGDGDYFDCISFEPSEYLTSIGGHYGPVEQRGAAVMRSLEFGTNRRKYGPFGWEEGTPFCFDFHSGLDFGGFHGRSTGSHLSALGIYVKSISLKHHFKPDPPQRHAAPPRLCSASVDPCACVPKHGLRLAARHSPTTLPLCYSVMTL
ncbi:Jacalin [Musa troglodytarum]|uniref:Jacalin n=2 Tax=Musa troglodytarum TaxID=320322 RepID=A0A9E7KG00_9LILI|nr:Jacalin [Musa troglodytarum]